MIELIIDSFAGGGGASTGIELALSRSPDTAAARAQIPAPILRTASGEPPLGYAGMVFRRDQGEAFEPHASYAAAGWIGVIELEDGKWLAQPPGFRIDAEQFASRDVALRTAIARMIRKARRYARAGEGEGTHWTEGYAGRVIEWALGLKPERRRPSVEGQHNGDERNGPPADPRTIDEKTPHQGAAAAAATPSGHPGSEAQAPESSDPLANIDSKITDSAASARMEESARHAESSPQLNTADPIVRALCEAHRARKTYPAGHTFAMTNPVVNGQAVTLGTCSCGDVFSYPYGKFGHERMDAAIEAHWQKFDHLPEKVDGRGNPIGAGVVPASMAKKPRKKKTPAPEGMPAPAPASSSFDLEGAGAPDIAEAACPPALRSVGDANASRPEPVPSPCPPDGAGSLISAAQICAATAAREMAAEPAEDWSPLLTAALDLAWREPPQVTETLAALLDFSRVYGVGGEVERPVLRWHGGKWKIAPWVMSFFPEHRIYVEPFGGAGSILLRKRRVYAEVYNDLDDVVSNLFRVLRDEIKATRLIEVLRLTPFSRAEFKEALLEAEDDVERARHLIVRSFMGFGSNAHSGSPTAEKTGFKSFTRPDEYRSTGFRANSNRSGTTPAHDWANYPDALPAIIDRLRGVIVEQRPAIEVMRQHDGEATLHYVDPPYLPETRSPANKYDLKHRMYRHELTVDDHRELLAFLQTLTGMVVLSGYPSQLYDEALPEWRRVTCETHADGARERTEVLWLNPACAAALDQQMPALFDLATMDVANTPPPSGLAQVEA